MAGYKHILFAADLTEDSKQVGEHAADMARRYGARLSLLHVLQEVDVAVGLDFVPPVNAGSDEARMNEAKEDLDRLADILGVSEAVRKIVLSNAIASEIRRFAQENEVDLIIVGSHGRHGFALLLGSTANAVLHGAPCDVLAVRVKA